MERRKGKDKAPYIVYEPKRDNSTSAATASTLSDSSLPRPSQHTNHHGDNHRSPHGSGNTGHSSDQRSSHHTPYHNNSQGCGSAPAQQQPISEEELRQQPARGAEAAKSQVAPITGYTANWAAQQAGLPPSVPGEQNVSASQSTAAVAPRKGALPDQYDDRRQYYYYSDDDDDETAGCFSFYWGEPTPSGKRYLQRGKKKSNRQIRP